MKQQSSHGGLYAAAALFAAVFIAVLTRPSGAGTMFWFGILWLILFALAMLAPDSDADKTRITSFIRRRDNAIVYSAATGAILKHLARLIAPNTVQKEPIPNEGRLKKLIWLMKPRAADTNDLNRLRKSPWSWPTMDAAMKLAIIYPLFLLLAQWAVTGQDTGIGSLVLLVAEPETLWRYATIGTLALYIVVFFLAAATQKPNFELAGEWLFWISFAVVSVVGSRAIGAVDIQIQIGGIDIVILKVTLASFGGIAVILVIKNAASGAFAVGFATASAGAFAVVYAATGPIAQAVGSLLLFKDTIITSSTLFLSVLAAVGIAAAFAFAFAIAFASTFASAISLACRNQRGLLAYVVLLGIIFVLLVSIFASVTPNISDVSKTLIFAIGLLPLLNAIFDYLSYGMTLTLIKFGAAQKNGWSLIVACFDALAAYVLLIALGCSIVLTLGLINALSGTTFIDVSTILTGLKDPATRDEYMWLTFTLLSTLVPTGMHLVIGVFSMTTWLPVHAKDWIADQIQREETGSLGTISGSALAALVGAIWCFAIAFLLTKGGALVYSNLEGLGLTALSYVEFVARFFGVI